MTTRRNARWLTLLAAVMIGALNPPVFKVFEFVVNEGTEWLWNDVFHADANRWAVILLPLLGSIVLSAAFKLLGQRRVVEQESDLGEYGSEQSRTPSLTNIAGVLLIGAGSLLFGASLGPEASLMAFAAGLGLLVAARFQLSSGGLLKLASIGALLVAFTGSIVPVLLPLLLLLKKAAPQLQALPVHDPRKLLGLIGKNRRLLAAGFVDAILPILLACSVAFLVLWLIDPSVAGYGRLPVDQPIRALDFVLAFVAGVIALIIGALLKLAITHFGRFAKWTDHTLPWPVSAGAFGLVIGILYMIGGESVQFSGSVGSKLLLEQAGTASVIALIGLLVVKLLVTAWSLATGYRGGLVFPSVYMGFAIALVLYHLSGLSDPGVLIGAVAGVFGALTGPVVAFIFIASVLPPHGSMWLVATCGILGAMFAQRFLQKITHSKQEI